MKKADKIKNAMHVFDIMISEGIEITEKNYTDMYWKTYKHGMDVLLKIHMQRKGKRSKNPLMHPNTYIQMMYKKYMEVAKFRSITQAKENIKKYNAESV